MEVFRISRSKYINDLSGFGASLRGSRWNPKGKPAVYTAGNRALALTEVLVHLTLDEIPEDYQIASIVIPESVSILEIPIKSLPHNWNCIDVNPETQKIGLQWISESNSCVLKVPSVVVKGEFNYVISPAHPECKLISIKNIEDFNFDHRFFNF